MKMVSKIVSIVLTLFIATQAKEMQHGTMGYLIDGMNDVKYKDARIAFAMWIDDLAKQNSVLVDIKYYDTYTDIMRDFEDSKIEYLSLNPIFYLRFQGIIDPLAQEYWSVQRGNNKLESYVIMVQKNSDIKTLTDLKDKTVITKSDNYMGKMFLDAELLKATQQESKNYIKGFTDTPKHSTALLDTFFGKTDACIVPSYTLDIVSEMNPAIKKQLKILLKSEELFFPVIAIFHNKTEKNVIDAFKENMATLDKNIRGQSILDLFKMKGLNIISKKGLEPVKKYYEDYQNLKKKYAKQQ